ncbi:MAG: glutathione S-transferase [Pseudomonadota bacterium]
MALKLHCFGESGHSYKAALALQFSGLPWEPVAVDFFNGETRTPEWRTAVNEMGECPVLHDTDHDYWITQSGAIQDYVSHLSHKNAGNSPEERREVMRWVLWDNTKLSSLAGPLRFLLHYVPEDKRPIEVIAWLQARVAGSYGILDTHLQGRDWIVGDKPTNADFTCCGYLYYPEDFGFDRSAYPAIDSWLSRLAALPGWAHPYDLMPPARPENRK